MCRKAQYLSVSEGYFEAMGATMAQGRAFTAFDDKDSPGVVIVNETFARRLFPDGRAIGRVIATTSGAIGPLGEPGADSAAAARREPDHRRRGRRPPHDGHALRSRSAW